MDIDSKEILRPKLEVILHTPPQPTFAATVTEIGEDIFWIDLPRDGRQMLVLQTNQRIKVGVSIKKDYYEAETAVLTVGKDKNKFYALVIPDKFHLAKERRYARVDYPVTVVFRAGDLTANSTLVNISAGGAMVYLVPDLVKVLDTGAPVLLSFKLEDRAFEVEVKLAWKKTYENIPFAGFEFAEIPADFIESLDKLARS